MVFVVFLHKAFVLVEMPHRLAESVPPEGVSQHLGHVNLEQNTLVSILLALFSMSQFYMLKKPVIFNVRD